MYTETHLKQILSLLGDTLRPPQAFTQGNGIIEISALFLVHYGFKLRQLFYDLKFEDFLWFQLGGSL